MTHPTSKIAKYIEHRVAGTEPTLAARLAGYSESGLKVAASRNEARDDVRTALRVAKRAGKVTTRASGRRPMEDDEVGGDTLHKLEPWKLKPHYANPLDLLRDVMNNPKAPGGLRIQCAKDALPYCHARKESSKKDEKQQAAEKAAKSNVFAGQVTPMRKAA